MADVVEFAMCSTQWTVCCTEIELIDHRCKKFYHATNVEVVRFLSHSTDNCDSLHSSAQFLNWIYLFNHFSNVGILYVIKESQYE